jgi:hypothetical protein
LSAAETLRFASKATQENASIFSITEKTSFAGKLATLCSGDAAEACKEVGLKSLSAARESAYADVIADYGK